MFTMRVMTARCAFRTTLPCIASGIRKVATVNDTPNELHRMLQDAIGRGDATAAAAAAASLARFAKASAQPPIVPLESDAEHLQTPAEMRVVATVRTVDTSFVDIFGAVEDNEADEAEAASHAVLKLYSHYFPHEITATKDAVKHHVRTEIQAVLDELQPEGTTVDTSAPLGRASTATVAVRVLPLLQHPDRSSIAVLSRLRELLTPAVCDAVTAAPQAQVNRRGRPTPQSKDAIEARDRLMAFLYEEYYAGAPSPQELQDATADIETLKQRGQITDRQQASSARQMLVRDAVARNRRAMSNAPDSKGVPAAVRFDVGLHDELIERIASLHGGAASSTDGDAVLDSVRARLSRRLLDAINGEASAGAALELLDSRKPGGAQPGRGSVDKAPEGSMAEEVRIAVAKKDAADALQNERGRVLAHPLPPLGMVIRFTVDFELGAAR
jgi:hypothetical protein